MANYTQGLRPSPDAPSNYVHMPYSEVQWFGRCADCKAVHMRAELTLVDNATTWHSALSVHPNYRRTSGPVRMYRRCEQRVWAKRPDPFAEHFDPVEQADLCEGQVYELYDQDVLLSAFLVGGPEAVLEIVAKDRRGEEYRHGI